MTSNNELDKYIKDAVNEHFDEYFTGELKYIKSKLEMLCAKFNKSMKQLIKEAQENSVNDIKESNTFSYNSNKIFLGHVCFTYSEFSKEYKSMILEDAMRGCVNLHNILSMAHTAIIAEESKSKLLSNYGKLAHAGSDKEREKLFIKECWNEWQKNPTKYKSKRAFADDMLDKCEHLESQKKITDWCREWEKM